MKKIAQYTILESPDSYALSKNVSQHIEWGWQPYGSLQVTLIKNSLLDMRYSQAMIKYAEINSNFLSESAQ